MYNIKNGCEILKHAEYLMHSSNVVFHHLTKLVFRMLEEEPQEEYVAISYDSLGQTAFVIEN
jgi:hypothetical protein